MTPEAIAKELSSSEEFFNRSTRVLTEADSQFAPAPGMMTVASHVAHAAQTLDWFVDGAFAPGGFDTDFEKLTRETAAVTSLEAARGWLARAFAKARATLAGKSREELAAPLPEGIMGGEPRLGILGAMLEHTAHHRGALTVYSRLRGKTPAMPYMEM